MDEITYDDWFWEQRFSIENLTEEELRIINELSKIPLINIEEIGDIADA